ncbi:MAG: cytochrome P450 [Actinomycetota bacterium]
MPTTHDPGSTPSATLDLGDPDLIADPYPTLAELRESAPITYDERLGVWLLTRFDDVHQALRDRRLGRQFRQRYTEKEFGQPPLDPRWASFHEHERWSLLFLEPPDHTRLRRLVSKVFTPRAVASIEPLVRGIATDIVADLAERDHFDLIADYAQPYSVSVICSMLGLPLADGSQLLEWSHDIVKMYEPDASGDQRTQADRSAGEFIDYTRDIIADKRARPDDLLVSQLVRVRDDGDVLSDAEIASTTMVLLEAGHEATVNGLANGMRALLDRPAQYRAVATGDVRAADAVEEMLRFDSPVQLFERWVLEHDVEIAGQAVPFGATIAMLFGSAQRDPRRFDRPDDFDVRRGGDTGHIGFGGGIHFCVGAPLARAELAVSVELLTSQFPDLRLAATPTHHPTFVIRGYQSLDLVPR